MHRELRSSPDEIDAVIDEGGDLVGSVLSGNRNFEGRVHPKVKASYLASPPLVVAYALAGTLDWDPECEPIGMGVDGPVMLADVWPSPEEIAEVRGLITPKMFLERYAGRGGANRGGRDRITLGSSLRLAR